MRRSSLAAALRERPAPATPEGPVRTRRYDDWTIDRWRVEPRLDGLKLDDPSPSDQAPPLWKDLTIASILAALLWAAAAVVFG